MSNRQAPDGASRLVDTNDIDEVDVPRSVRSGLCGVSHCVTITYTIEADPRNDDSKICFGDLKFQIDDFTLQIGDFTLQIGDSTLQIGDLKLQIGDSNVRQGPREGHIDVRTSR